ncbi:hypothetical protein TrVE_jg5396 [Triparma verrucosa]|uniref:P2X receptor n=1 Tax=Triparma verrucosa TaxID=1606542 RepID=A0A9W7EI57_9STRA|nr:hypothetical protein TrVE_jg5396 [Triparma verrucosa]
MGLLPSTVCGRDIDYVFAYPTVKMVKIQDSRLGLFKLFLVFMIVLYIAVFQLWKDSGYLQTEKVSGISRFTLQQPTVDDCSPTNDDCMNDFNALPDLAYCNQSSLPYDGDKYPCQYYESVGLGTMFESSILVTTRVTTRQEDLVCNSTSETTCPRVYNLTSPDAEKTYYSADVERFTVLFDTSVMATTLQIYGESSEMEGMLYVEKNSALCASYATATKSWGGKAITSTAPCYIAPNKTNANLDFFQLGILMSAADSDLDVGNNRYDGATMIVEVTYTNMFSWSGLSRKIQYTYKPYLSSSTSFKLYDNVWEGTDNYREKRTLLNKHGIKIDLVQSGDLGAFSFAQLLISLTTSLTLLAMATVITDYIALYFLPDKEKYDEAKYEWTEDFSDMREASRDRKRRNKGLGELSEPGADESYNRLIDSEEHMNLYGAKKGGKGGKGKE